MIIHEDYVIAPVSSGGGGLGGYYFDPNPFVEGQNSFGEGSATETAALAQAKAYFTKNPDLDAEYNADPMRMINIHWKDGSGTSYSTQYAKVKNGDNYEWAKLNFGGSINLANHDFIELRDGGHWIDIINENTAQIDHVQADNVAIHAKINELSDGIDENKADIAANANRINVHESRLDDLTTKVNTNTTNITNNSNEIVKLHATDKDLQDQIDNIKAGESDFAIGAKNLGPEGFTYPILKEALDDRKVVGQGLVPNGQLGIHAIADGGLRLSAYGQFLGVFDNDSKYEDFFITSDLPRAATTCAILKDFLDRTVEPAVHRHNVFVQRQGGTITIVPLSGELVWDDSTRTSHQVKEIGIGKGLSPSWDSAKSKLTITNTGGQEHTVPTFLIHTDSMTVAANTGALFKVGDSISNVNATLPATPEEGDWVAIGDYNASVNPKHTITILGNGKKIHGQESIVLTHANSVVFLSYLDDDDHDGLGWKIVDGVGFTGGPSSAFRFDPAIPMEGKNKFVGGSLEAAEKARDSYFNNDKNKLKPYDDDPYLLIELSLRVTDTISRPIYQSRSGNIWIEAFSGNMVTSQKDIGGTLKPLRTIRFDDTTGTYDNSDYTVVLKGVRGKIGGNSYGINEIVVTDTGSSSVEKGTLTIATSSGVTVDKILSLIDTDAAKSNVHIVKDTTTNKLTFNVDASAIGLTADKIIELTNTGKDITAKLEDSKVTFEIDNTKLLDKLRQEETTASDSGLLKNSATVEVDRAKIGGVDQIKFHAKLTALKGDGTELKKFNRIKPGAGVVIKQGDDPTAIEDIIIEVDPEFSGMTAKAGTETTYQNITKIDVFGDKAMSSVSDGELNLNIQANMLTSTDLNSLKSTYPPASNPHRLGYIENDKVMMLSDGTEWKEFPVGRFGQSYFLGVHDKQSELIAAALKPNIAFVKNQTFGYIRKANSIGGTSKTIYHRMWKWNLEKTNPTSGEIENPNNWNKDDAWSAYGQSIIVVGSNTEYDTWTPTSIDKAPFAKDHAGQFIYYNTTDPNTVGHYYSDGDKWNYGHGPASALTPNNFLAIVDTSGNVNVTKTNVGGKSKLKFDVEQTINVDGFNNDRTFETHSNKEKIEFGKAFNVNMNADDDTVVIKLRNDSQFLGVFETFDALATKAYSNVLNFTKGCVVGHVGTLIYSWNSDTTNPNETEVKTDSNWTKTDTSGTSIDGVEIVGKDFDKTPAAPVDQKVKKIHFGDTLNTEVVTDASGSHVKVSSKGLTVSGINEALTPTEYKGVQSIALEGSHHLKSYDATTGKLDLKLGIVLMGEDDKDEYLDVGALRLKGGTITSETVAGKNYYTYEPTESIFHGSVNGGTAQHITQIEADGDAAIVGKKMTIKAEKTLFVADSKTNLITNYAPASYKNRLGMTTDNNTIYLSTKIAYDSEEYNWSEVASKSHFTDVESLNLRFPKQVPKTESYVGDDYKQLRQVFLTSDATNTIDLPIQEDGFLYNMYASDHTETEHGWVQEFHGSHAGGNSWVRRRQTTGSGQTWGDWERIQTSKLEDHNHTVMVCDNNELYSQGFKDNDVIPYMVYQDPTSNIVSEGSGRFKFIRPGSYNVSFMTQFTWNEYPTTESDIVTDLSHYTFEVAKCIKTDTGETFSTVKQVTTSNVKWDDTTISGKKLFPMVKGTVPAMVVTASDIANPNISFVFRIAIGNKTTNMMKQMMMDPYKNMIAIDPVVSKCKTAHTVINTLYRSLGGISFQPGYEVRSQAPVSGTTPRVFGDTYSNNVIG